jgi:hypothetical protein
MRRRDFIKAITVSAAWPLAARGQQREPLRRVGILMGTALDTPGGQDRDTAFLEAFEQFLVGAMKPKRANMRTN